jgi:hypothetical protein
MKARQRSNNIFKVKKMITNVKFIISINKISLINNPLHRIILKTYLIEDIFILLIYFYKVIVIKFQNYNYFNNKVKQIMSKTN